MRSRRDYTRWTSNARQTLSFSYSVIDLSLDNNYEREKHDYIYYTWFIINVWWFIKMLSARNLVLSWFEILSMIVLPERERERWKWEVRKYRRINVIEKAIERRRIMYILVFLRYSEKVMVTLHLLINTSYCNIQYEYEIRLYILFILYSIYRYFVWQLTFHISFSFFTKFVQVLFSLFPSEKVRRDPWFVPLRRPLLLILLLLYSYCYHYYYYLDCGFSDLGWSENLSLFLFLFHYVYKLVYACVWHCR